MSKSKPDNPFTYNIWMAVAMIVIVFTIGIATGADPLPTLLVALTTTAAWVAWRLYNES